MRKRIFAFLVSLVLLVSCAIPAFANDNYDKNYYYDIDCHLLSEYEENEINDILRDCSEETNMDVMVVVINDELDMPIGDFCDEVWDENGFGQGEDKDGCLLVLSNLSSYDGDRDWNLYRRGYAKEVYNEDAVDYFEEEVVEEYFKDDNFYTGFKKYAELTEKLTKDTRDGKPYHESVFKPGYIICGLIFGLILAIVILSVLKGQLKSVCHKALADDYLVGESLVITNANDVYITSHVTKVKRETESKGSSSSTSSGGHVSGGKF